MKRTALAVALSAMLALTPTLAYADESAAEDLHPALEYAMSQEPGGIVEGYGSAVWPDLGMRLDVSLARAVGSCATGDICAFSDAGMAGVRLSWSTCGSKSTAALATVGSIANARSSGTLSAREGTTVRATAAANQYANVPVAYRPVITNVYC